jgi:hypothetical protein
MYENNPELPMQELLDKIRSSSMQNVSGVNKSNVAMALPTFSALLVKLSNDASKTADKNMAIQRTMMVITSIILAISIFQLTMTFFPVSHKLAVQPQTNIGTTETISTEDAKKHKNVKPDIIHNKQPHITK